MVVLSLSVPQRALRGQVVRSLSQRLLDLRVHGRIAAKSRAVLQTLVAAV